MATATHTDTHARPRRPRSVTASPEPTAPLKEAAREAGLRYSTDDRPGITRRRSGRGFAYRGPDGTPIHDRTTLARIRALAVPPAWTDVWINKDPSGHLQASGRDAKGRKQYRYHARFREARESSKFDRMLAFAAALPRIRQRVDEDLGRYGLPREKVLATVVRLLELTLIRVGNEEYARLNDSFGLTTLQDRHAKVDGSALRFSFTGKSGQRHRVEVRDRRLGRIVARCQDLPGQDLLQYVDDDGEVRDVRSEDVNAYLREIGGDDFTAKDFRTWAGTVLAYRALRALQPDGRTTKKAVVEAMRETAERLGNTPAVARKSYVHPAVLDAYMAGDIGEALVEAAEEQVAPPARPTEEEEAAVVALLRQRMAHDRRAAGQRTGRSGRSGPSARRPRTRKGG
jgi:DNA topoisomerase-1